MDFEEMDRLFSYKHKTGNVRNKIDRGHSTGGRIAKAGEIATNKTGGGYLEVQFRRDGRQVRYLAHRVAWLLYYGVDPGEFEIDHINRHSKTNNKIENLRLVNRQVNMTNTSKRSDNTSGVTGVSWNKNAGKWKAYINKNGEQKGLGYFEDKFEAICVRKSAERRLEYHPNHGK